MDQGQLLPHVHLSGCLTHSAIIRDESKVRWYAWPVKIYVSKGDKVGNITSYLLEMDRQGSCSCFGMILAQVCLEKPLLVHLSLVLSFIKPSLIAAMLMTPSCQSLVWHFTAYLVYTFAMHLDLQESVIAWSHGFANPSRCVSNLRQLERAGLHVGTRNDVLPLKLWLNIMMKAKPTFSDCILTLHAHIYLITK